MEICTLGYEIPSDHRPIICSLKQSAPLLVTSNHYNYKKINWNTFQNFLDNNISFATDFYNSPFAIDQEINNFVNIILEARDISTPKSTQKYNSDFPDKTEK